MENESKKVIYNVSWSSFQTNNGMPQNKYFSTKEKADEFVVKLKNAVTTLQLWHNFVVNLTEIELE